MKHKHIPKTIEELHNTADSMIDDLLTYPKMVDGKVAKYLLKASNDIINNRLQQRLEELFNNKQIFYIDILDKRYVALI